MRIKHKVGPNIAEDTSMKQILFWRDDALSEVVIDGYIHQNSGTFNIAASATEDIPLGDVTAVKGCFLRFNQDVKIKLNGSVTELQVRTITNASGTSLAKFFAEMDITQITIIGHATEITTGVFCVWGDTA